MMEEIPPYAIGRRLEAQGWRRFLWVSADINFSYDVYNPEKLMRSDVFETLPEVIRANNLPENKKLPPRQIKKWVQRKYGFKDIQVIDLYIEGDGFPNMYEVFVK